jgi:hypothetical protein
MLPDMSALVMLSAEPVSVFVETEVQEVRLVLDWMI